jgi:hypothetical protein
MTRGPSRAPLIAVGLTATAIALSTVAVAGPRIAVGATQNAAVLTFWPGNPTPRVGSTSTRASTEVGMRFHSRVAGSVVGLRFYKGAKNVGVHVGGFWTNSGRRLAGVTFRHETKKGWQAARFARPVAINAGVTYVVGYLARHGHYALSPGYFRRPVNRGPLVAAGQPNGVYVRASRSRFPTRSGHRSNFWVEPMFTAKSRPASNSLPAQVLNLINWKLTLPIAQSDSDDPVEITQPELSKFSDPYFKTNAAGTGVVFQADVGGATTSGSAYPRSELREMTDGGTQLASWSTSSGTHVMTVREASTHLPVAKPQVVMAQIHDASDDIIEVLADGSRSSGKGTYSICVRYNGSTQSPCLDNSYTSGTPFTLTLKASGGQITVAYNGRTVLTFSNDTSGCYFKAGAYTQSNPSKGDEPDAYGQVVIYNLTVSHTS